ncbi:glycosyltransferase [Limibacter armeniacum]|uniref:glycosyltransferase n=1 Tax=Limibacter armeniacum TaxID=466084 RepID=UPI002FE588B6
MNILIVNNSTIPAFKYGGTERVIWGLGKGLTELGHKVTFLVNEGSHCPFADVLTYNPDKGINEQIPDGIDLVHMNIIPNEPINIPYVMTVHGNNSNEDFPENAIFISQNHAERHDSDCFVYNGLLWDDYDTPDFNKKKDYLHFLGKAAWRIKNVKGAINIAQLSGKELRVLGGHRLNIKMGFRLTLDPRIKFHGMVGGKEKYQLLNGSRGLVFPVRWHEPFGLALTESLFYGAPVFGTPYGALPELITSEVGFLSNDKHQLAEAIKNSSFSPKVCHEYARDTFNHIKMAKSYIEKYEKVLNGEKLNTLKPKMLPTNDSKFLPFH